MSLNGTVWAPIGPSPIDQGSISANGQVTAIAVHPSNSNIIYIGTAWGGIWLTRDGGATWTPIFDRAPALGVGEPGALAIDPVNTNIIYVGTSNRDGSQFSGEATQPPAGLFKSTDGGSSWIRLGSGFPAGPASNANIFFSQVINVVIVDPVNHQTVYLASNRGVFVSTDGGFNWKQGAGPPAFQDVRSLQLDATSPTSARILYAGVTSSGIWQSTDSGLNWTLILSPTTPAVAGKLAGGGFSKVVVALAPPTSSPDPAGVQVLYATMVGTSGAPDPVGVFLSTDQGHTWTAQTATGLPGTTYGGYSFHMAVDPASPGDGVGDIIYYGTLGQARSTNAGSSFVGLTGLHPDTHSWAFSPQAGPLSVVYCGNDGGIFKCTSGVHFNSCNGGGLQTALFYNLDVKPDATASVTLGALQDNGVVTTAGAIAPTWKMGFGGDGFDVAHDGQSATQAYGRSNATILKSTNDGDSYGGISPPWLPAESGVYLAAVATDPNNSGGVYASSNQNLWQSTDGGSTWPVKAPIPGSATEVDVAPTNSNNVVVAVGSRVLVSTDALQPGGLNLTDITRDLPSRFVGRVAFDPNDPATIYAVLGGFSGFAGGHVYRTSLSDTTWTDISPALDLPFNAIALDGSENPTTLYAGTDFGVLRSVDGGANWSVLDDIHFPRAPVFELVFHNGELRAATFGRGVFSFVKPPGPVIAVTLEDNLAFGTVCKGPRYLTITLFNVGVADLVVTSVQRLMGSAGFTVLPSPTTPLVLAPGEDIEFVVAYSPTGSSTFEAATIRIITNDPVAPVVDLTATGVRGLPKLATAIVDSGNFGDVCLGAFRDELLILNNSGKCSLAVTNITSSSPQFLPPQVITYPLAVGAGDCLDVPIRFQPSSFGPKSATITIDSDDPSGPRTITISGNAPSGKLAVTGSTSFGGVTACCCADRTISICNVGDCKLHVSSVAFKRKSAHWRILNNPFPATLHPGSCLGLTIRYKATEKCARCCELIIVSDDPATPVKTLELLAYTVWNECGCAKCCEDCRKGTCEKHHSEHCQQGYPCCDDDDEAEGR